MNNKNRDSLIALLTETQTVYQDISRKIHWSTVDSEHLDDLMHAKALSKEIGNRLLSATGSRALAEYVPSFLAYKAWQRTKAVYSFNEDLVEAISLTADSRIYVSLLERLPFKDMLFFFPEKGLPLLNDERIVGMYVHIESHPENLWIAINALDNTQQDGPKVLPGIGIGFPITNGMKISEVFETPQFLEWLSSFKLPLLYYNQLDEKRISDLIFTEKRALNTAINLLYYLSAKNADIKSVKRQRKQPKPSTSTNSDPLPAIKQFDVGAEHADIIYRHFNDNIGSDEDEDDISEEATPTREITVGKKRRPHARRAHWQHYWTGKGRSNLELRWKSDLFVGARRDDQSTVVYEVAREPLKGKRNPNTSKKKRNKR